MIAYGLATTGKALTTGDEGKAVGARQVRPWSLRSR